MSDQKENKPFVNFTEKEWIEYLSHRMQPEKETEFNRISKQQEFTADAIEGIDSIANRSHVLSTINQINQKVKERSGKTTGYTMKSNEFNYIRIGAIAAVFVLLIGIGSTVIYFMNNSTRSSVVAVTAESTENPESLLPPDVVSDASVTASTPTDSSAARQSPPTIDSIKAPAVKPNSTLALNAKTYSPPPPAAATADAAKSTPVAKNKTLVVVSDNKEAASTAGKQSASGYTSAAEIETTPTAVSHNSPPLSQVIAEKKVVIPREEQNSSISQYQKGVEEMNKGNNDEAIKSFDNVISQNSGFKVDAKWNKAQILIKKGENKKAIKILKELAENENPYKNKAKELIKSLE